MKVQMRGVFFLPIRIGWKTKQPIPPVCTVGITNGAALHSPTHWPYDKHPQ